MNKSKFLAFIVLSQLFIFTTQLSVAQVVNNRTRGEINPIRTNNIPTQIDLVQYAPQLNGIPPCFIDIVVDDNTIINQVMTKGSMHSFILPIFSDTIKDPKITLSGSRDRARASRACPVIVDFKLAVIKESMWKTWETKSNPTIVNCMKNNLNKVGLSYPLNSYGEGVGIPFHSEFIRLEQTCQKAIEKFNEKKEYACQIPSKVFSNYNGTCVDKLIIRNLNANSRGNETSDSTIITNESQLIDALLALKMVVKARFESDSSRVERLKDEEKFIENEKQLAEKKLKEEQYNAEMERLNAEQKKLADEKRAKLAAEQRAKQIAEENERRKKWEESPEGKRTLAEAEIKQKQQKEEKIKAEAAEKIRFAKEFPYFAVISCGVGSNHLNTMACFSNNLTSLEIKNGNEYGLYKIMQIANRMIPNSREQKDGLMINLRSAYEINVQNGADSNSFILGVKIFQRSNNNLLFQKQVDRFGVIRVGS
jgi:hypothetical protein